MDPRQMIGDLQGGGMTQAEIGARIGVGQAYVSELSRGNRGKRLGFAVGSALLSLWRERCGQKSCDVTGSCSSD